MHMISLQHLMDSMTSVSKVVRMLILKSFLQDKISLSSRFSYLQQVLYSESRKMDISKYQDYLYVQFGDCLIPVTSVQVITDFSEHLRPFASSFIIFCSKESAVDYGTKFYAFCMLFVNNHIQYTALFSILVVFC